MHTWFLPQGVPTSAKFVAWVSAREDDGSLSFEIRGNSTEEVVAA